MTAKVMKEKAEGGPDAVPNGMNRTGTDEQPVKPRHMEREPELRLRMGPRELTGS